MALRIAGPGQQAVGIRPSVETEDNAPEDNAPEIALDEAIEEEGSEPVMDTGKISPQIARYMSADQGPFICANCTHFQDDMSCQVVSGPIDPEGVCILFTSRAGENAVEQPTEYAEEPVEEVL